MRAMLEFQERYASEAGCIEALAKRGIEVHVMQPSHVPLDRRARRAKTDLLDVEMLLRTLLAWLRGEPRVCSMVPVASVWEKDGRRFSEWTPPPWGSPSRMPGSWYRVDEPGRIRGW